MKELTQNPASTPPSQTPMGSALVDANLNRDGREDHEPPEVRAAKDLAQRYRLSFVELLPTDQESPIDYALFNEIPVDLMVRYQFLPLRRDEKGLHIETPDTEVQVKYRIDGALYAKVDPIDLAYHQTLISRIKVMSELDIAERRVPQDGRFRVRYKGRNVDFRVSIMPTVHGEDAVIRILDKEQINEAFRNLDLNVVGFDPDDLRKFRRYIAEPYGMVLVTGPTGSGKTTTLYAALNEIRNEEDKIITIEDPVEYQLHGITQIPVNEKKGLTFDRGLRSILRHDPDKIMIGEIRDTETAQIAIQSALTGHLVFTTEI